MRKFSTNKLCILALCSVINLIGGQIALLLRLLERCLRPL